MLGLWLSLRPLSMLHTLLYNKVNDMKYLIFLILLGEESCIGTLTLTERVLGKYDLMTRKDSVNGRLPNRAPVIHMVGVI